MRTRETSPRLESISPNSHLPLAGPDRWLQFVSIGLLGPVKPTAGENYHFMAKCSDHYTEFKAVYFSSSMGKFVQDFDMPLRFLLLRLRADGGGELIVDYYHDYCKTMANIQQFSSHNSPGGKEVSLRLANEKGAQPWTWPGACWRELCCRSFFG